MTARILIGDMRALLAEVPDASIDHILTDPPYGETSLEWDRWVEGWPALVRPKLKLSGSMWVFGSQRMFWDRRDDFAGWRLVQDVIWEKHNGSGFIADRFKRVHECALQLVPETVAWGSVYKAPQYTNDATPKTARRKTRPTHTGSIERGHYVSHDGGPRLMRSVLYVRSEHGRAEHPTQKPLGIVEPLLLYACPPGGTVLDPFAGSGTTGVLARRHGMSAVLIEANPAYARVIASRLDGDAPLLRDIMVAPPPRTPPAPPRP